MILKNVNKMFTEVKGYKSSRIPQMKVEDLANWTGVEGTITAAVIQRADGLYIPVVFVNDKNAWMTMGFVECGYCVMNA